MLTKTQKIIEEKIKEPIEIDFLSPLGCALFRVPSRGFRGYYLWDGGSHHHCRPGMMSGLNGLTGTFLAGRQLRSREKPEWAVFGSCSIAESGLNEASLGWARQKINPASFKPLMGRYENGGEAIDLLTTEQTPPILLVEEGPQHRAVWVYPDMSLEDVEADAMAFFSERKPCLLSVVSNVSELMKHLKNSL